MVGLEFGLRLGLRLGLGRVGVAAPRDGALVFSELKCAAELPQRVCDAILRALLDCIERICETVCGSLPVGHPFSRG